MDALTALLEARKELMEKVATLDAAIKLFQPSVSLPFLGGVAVEPVVGVFAPAPKPEPAAPSPAPSPIRAARAGRPMSSFSLAILDILQQYRTAMTAEEVVTLMPDGTSLEAVQRALYYLSHPKSRKVLRIKTDANQYNAPSVFQYNPNYRAEK